MSKHLQNYQQAHEVSCNDTLLKSIFPGYFGC